MITNYLIKDKARKDEPINWYDYDAMSTIGFNKNRDKGNYFFKDKIYKKESENIQLPKNFAINVQINGEKISLPFELLNIANEINHSKFIVKLEGNWDSENAKVIDRSIWEATVIFLTRYSTFILQEYNIVIETPEINPCKDGSIDLSWRTSKARLLINIRQVNQKIFAYYYGDQYDNLNPIKGNVTTDLISDFLAVWMKCLS